MSKLTDNRTQSIKTNVSNVSRLLIAAKYQIESIGRTPSDVTTEDFQRLLTLRKALYNLFGRRDDNYSSLDDLI